MKISTKGRYGLRTMLELSKNFDDTFIPLKEIAKNQGISDKYLEQIINQLNKAGFVKSERGPQGGYKLSRNPNEITVGEILRTLEGSLSPVSCVDDNGKSCKRLDDCVTFSLWVEINNAIKNVIDNKTLYQLLMENKK